MNGCDRKMSCLVSIDLSSGFNGSIECVSFSVVGLLDWCLIQFVIGGVVLWCGLYRLHGLGGSYIFPCLV
jgi:hypothetical protein